MSFVFDSVPDRYKTEELWNIVVSKDALILIYCPNRYKTQKIYDEARDDCLAASKYILDWFVTSKMLEKFHAALNTNDGILFFDEDFCKDTFFANQMDIGGVDLDKIDKILVMIMI